MQQNKIVSRQRLAYGDRAVDGLLAGAGAGALMIAVLLFLALLSGERLSVLLGHFDPAQEGAALLGLLSHAAVSAIYGALFAVAYSWLVGRVRKLEPHMLVAALAYGLLIWLAAEFLFMPAVDSPLLAVPAWQFALAHAIYGLALGELLRRQR
ncbi:MAG: hypothetical protein R3300_10755 [Candidatus Promineifilaceae bacterium]|nr:hypothetical protein [Candidatus Promineifilaceae bacterium]